MRLSLNNISLTAVGALTILLSSSSTTALPSGLQDLSFRTSHVPGNSQPHLQTRAEPASKPYANHRVVRMQLQTEEELKKLSEAEDQLHLDFFSHKTLGGNMDVRVPSESFDKFKALGLSYTVLSSDLQQLIDAERDENDKSQQRWQAIKRSMDGWSEGTDALFHRRSESPASIPGADDWFATYHSYEDHTIWLDAQIKNRSDIATGFSAGKSYEGREQAGIKIGKGPNNVVLHGLQHAREWISGSVVEYLIHQLMTGTDAKVAKYLKKYTFHIIPIMNPDGFVMTQNGVRMHRKNAQPNPGNADASDTSCIGTDRKLTCVYCRRKYTPRLNTVLLTISRFPLCTLVNRNWDIRWNASTEADATDACSEVYRGTRAFSAPETANIGKYLRDTPNVVSYIDFHAYSQMWLTPHGYAGPPPESYKSYLKPLAAGAVAALKKVYGTKFTYGESYNTINYETFGASDDYALSVGVGAPFTVELRDTGNFGFLLPADQILPSGKEMWEAFKYILDNLKTK
ncbi:hypothetical protein BGZ70_008538 [Mortierella alpina]|uniref:Peptidase M14 domain-containing protein n=1 Tax=Mortierella alpina TaxID=64518 RepID=A0A9P6JDU7_MORAP|nr:hypothetical protein BGZ70_008538 [Mortierella alpina]